MVPYIGGCTLIVLVRGVDEETVIVRGIVHLDLPYVLARYMQSTTAPASDYCCYVVAAALLSPTFHFELCRLRRTLLDAVATPQQPLKLSPRCPRCEERGIAFQILTILKASCVDESGWPARGHGVCRSSELRLGVHVFLERSLAATLPPLHICLCLTDKVVTQPSRMCAAPDAHGSRLKSFEAVCMSKGAYNFKR